jgi:hypothetical protein
MERVTFHLVVNGFTPEQGKALCLAKLGCKKILRLVDAQLVRRMRPITASMWFR